MAQYNGWKLPQEVMLVCREPHSKTPQPCMKAYLVDPKDKKQLENARGWAEWIEYGPSHLNKETDKYEHEYEIEHKPVEFTFDNEGFEFELLESANGSNQGGKLSFWNCLVSKDNNTFKIGIAADLLLDLLKENDFVKGKCTDKVLFARQSGKVGVVTKNSESYKEALKDEELKKKMSKKTSKYNIGDNVLTTTLNQIYLGSIYRYYKFEDNAYRCCSNLLDCEFTLTKLTTPEVHHVFLTYDEKYIENGVIDLEKVFDGSYWWGELANNKTARTLSGKHYTLTTTIQEAFHNKFSTFESSQVRPLYYTIPNDSQVALRKLVHYCRDCYFGYSPNDKPFDIDPKIMQELKKLKYIKFIGFGEDK